MHGITVTGRASGGGTFVVPASDYAVLAEAFSRDVFLSHENATERRGCLAYWLAADLCRQPHHPPAVLLKLPKGEPNTENVRLHIRKSVSASGLPYWAVLAYSHPNGRARHRLCVASFATHRTGGGSGYKLDCPEALFHLRASTGGTGHGLPFHLLVGYGNETVSVETWYRSLNGGVTAGDNAVVTIAETATITMPPYSGRLIITGRRHERQAS